jgi:hypothetical protein
VIACCVARREAMTTTAPCMTDMATESPGRRPDTSMAVTT